MNAPLTRTPTLRRRERNPAESPRTLSSERLFGPAREVQIEHQGEVYRLIRTRNGRLLLNK